VNVLGLCAGVGGLELGIRDAHPGARCVGLVEWDPYAAAVLAERMASGDLEPFPRKPPLPSRC
jgi:DNA (cytosine-5)-methyltransferase 1